MPKILPGTDQSKPMNAVRTTDRCWLVNAEINIYELMEQLKAAGVGLVLGDRKSVV
jgi:hypothetical protein